MARIECIECGRVNLHYAPAPHPSEPRFVTWVRDRWPGGDAQQTRLGFVIWCSEECSAKWRQRNKKYLRAKPYDGHAHQLEIRQEEKAWKQGLVG